MGICIGRLALCDGTHALGRVLVRHERTDPAGTRLQLLFLRVDSSLGWYLAVPFLLLLLLLFPVLPIFSGLFSFRVLFVHVVFLLAIAIIVVAIAIAVVVVVVWSTLWVWIELAFQLQPIWVIVNIVVDSDVAGPPVKQRVWVWV